MAVETAYAEHLLLSDYPNNWCGERNASLLMFDGLQQGPLALLSRRFARFEIRA